MNTQTESANVTPINLSVAANETHLDTSLEAGSHDRWIMSEIVDGLMMIADSICADAANDPLINP
ncbi:MAG: hypothetical protein AAF736_15305 [Pseudomonadota bacterium]